MSMIDETETGGRFLVGLAVGSAISLYLWALGALSFLLARSAMDLAL